LGIVQLLRSAVAAARQPLVADACLAVLVVAAALPQQAGASDDPLAWLSVGAVCAPLVWRRRAPVVVFWTVLGLVVASLVLDVIGAHEILAPWIAIYTVARHRRRRHLWPPAAGAVPLAAAWLWHGGPWWDLAAMAGILAATLLLGINLRTREAYLAAVEDRAQRLEQEREQQARLAVATERTRIAREMHDIVAHNLAVMVALADGATLIAAAAPQRASEAMQQVSTTGRQALSEMRRLVGLLRDGEPGPADLDGRAPQPGLADLNGLVAQVRAAGVEVKVRREGVPGPWGPGAGLAIYRIVQEALTNILKHAGPHAGAEVRLRYEPARAEVEVLDDGAGQPARTVPPAGRHGLAGMAERAASYGGRLEAGPRPGAGWRVHAYLCFHEGAGQ
jgi:signal transduction histidine kinase